MGKARICFPQKKRFVVPSIRKGYATASSVLISLASARLTLTSCISRALLCHHLLPQPLPAFATVQNYTQSSRNCDIWGNHRITFVCFSQTNRTHGDSGQGSVAFNLPSALAFAPQEPLSHSPSLLDRTLKFAPGP